MLDSVESIPVALVAPAAELAAAQRVSEAAKAKLDAAIAHHDQVAARIADADGRRREMIARCASGDRRPDDALALAVLDADKEELATMAREADAAIAAARQAHETAGNAVSTKKNAMDQAEVTRLEAALASHYEALEGKMLATLARLDQVGRQLHRQRPAVTPSKELRHELRRLAAAFGQY